MSKHGAALPALGLATALVVLVTTGTCIAAPALSSTSSAVARTASAHVEIAHADDSERRDETAERRPAGAYNDQYVFGLTRGIADSTMHPAAKILVFPMTVPLDLALLPFEVIGGLF